MSSRIDDKKHSALLSLLMLGLTMALVPACVDEGDDDDAEADVSDGDSAEVLQSISWNGHEYLFILSPASWEQASATCKANGYYLVTVNGTSEETWLGTKQKSYGTGTFWIGLSDKGIEQTWQWVKGTSGFRNWTPGAPNSTPGNVDDCVYDKPSTGKWADGDCSIKRRFICEKAL